MMTTKKSRFSTVKKLALLPILAILFILFTEKVNAQNEKSVISEKKSQNETQNAISFKNKSSTKLTNTIISFSKNRIEVSEFKVDTIKKKQNAATPPPPPMPSEFAQIPAEFPGGVNTLRQSVANAFDTSVFKGDEGLIKTTVFLSIDESGKISNIFAEGENQKFNAEAVRALKVSNADKVWKPATEDSNPVKTVYKLPLTMQFEGSAVKN